MCDDLDKLLGGENAIPQVKRLLGAAGADASHYFVSSPKCTPSRSAWLSGRHYHNLRCVCTASYCITGIQLCLVAATTSGAFVLKHGCAGALVLFGVVMGFF